MAAQVRPNVEEHRYEIWVDGELAGFTQAIEQGNAVVFPHTEVEEKFAGQGLAKQLIGAALDAVRAQGKTVVPICPFVQSFITRNPEYGDLLA